MFAVIFVFSCGNNATKGEMVREVLLKSNHRSVSDNYFQLPKRR